MNPNMQQRPEKPRRGSIRALLGVFGVRLSQQESPTPSNADDIVRGVEPLQAPAANQRTAADLRRNLGDGTVLEAVVEGGLVSSRAVAPKEPQIAATTIPELTPAAPEVPSQPAFTAGPVRPTQWAPKPAEVAPVPAGGLVPLEHDPTQPVHSLVTGPRSFPRTPGAPDEVRSGDLPFVGPAPAHAGAGAPISQPL